VFTYENTTILICPDRKTKLCLPYSVQHVVDFILNFKSTMKLRGVRGRWRY